MLRDSEGVNRLVMGLYSYQGSLSWGLLRFCNRDLLFIVGFVMRLTWCVFVCVFVGSWFLFLS